MENALKSLPSTDRQEFADFEQDPTFLETIGASLAYKYDPLMDRINEASTFGLSPEEGYVPKDNIPNDLKPFASTLLRATNQKHMNFLAANIREGQETRRILERSGIGLQFVAELFDPINYIGIPFARAASFGQNFLRSGVSTGAVVSAQEAVRFPLDPLATKEEAMFTIGSSFLIGGAIGSTINIPAQRRAEALRSGEVEIKRLEEAIMPVDDKPPTAEIAASFFTDSWIYKAVPTPLKSILTDKSVPNSVKLRTLKIANDSGILLAANREGKKIGNSTYQNAKLFDGEWVSVFDDVMNIWGESTGKGVVSFLDYSIKTDFDKWFALIDSKAMRGIAPADDFEARAINKINSFYETWEKRLTEQGEIGTVGHYSKIIIKKNKRIEAIQKRLNGNISPEYRLTLEGQLRRQAEQIDEMQAIIKDIEETGGPVMPPNEKVFRPRYWDFDAIKANREAFETILRNWYTANPSIISRGQNGKYGRVDLSNNEKAVAARAKSTVDTILGIKDVTDPDIGYYGMGKSKHFKHRLVDIPNELVLDFIQTNPTAVMKAYTQRVGPRYEFSRQFDGQSIDDILDDTFNEMMDAGSTREQAHKAMKNMRALYKRVVGGVQRDPESWDQKFAKTLRDLAQLNYLGSAGFSTITEPAKIMMEHGIGKTMRGLFSIMKDSQLSLGAKEGRMAAEGLDNLLHTAHLRIVDDVNNNPFKSDIFDRIKHPYYALNLLGPFTKILKDFDAMMRSHTLIDYSVRWSQGKATKMEQEYLLRYNIDLEDAKKIANAPWQKSQSGMYMANTQAWTNSIEFPSTTADVISGPTGVNRANGDYSPAFYRASDNKIFIDEEHVTDIMYPERGWENPRTEGVKPIEKGIINSPEDYVAFVKMHEIMHSLNRPEDLGIFIKPLKTVSKTKRKVSISSKISKLEKKAKLLFDEANALEKPTVNSKEFNEALEKANSLRINTIEELNKTVDEIRKISKESQDFYESMQSGFKPDDKRLKEMIEKEINLTNTATNLRQELTDIDASIKNLMTATESASGINRIADSTSPSSQKVNELTAQRVQIEKEIETRQFLKNNKIDYDDLSNNLKNKASDLAEEDYNINNRLDDDSESFIAQVNREEKAFNKKLSKFKKDVKVELKALSKKKTKDSKPTNKLTKEQKADYENAINDLAVAEFKKQTRVDPETVKTFRSALSGGILNTILMGTPADKPMITDGIVYIPMRVARQFGMKEDPEFTGYARIENGLLGLPFQFFSYSFAALNKTTAAYGHGQLKNQWLGSAIAIGLGYMVLQYKTPSFVDMSFQDQFSRAFDYSGIMPLYSDIMYTAMSTSLALGGPNLTGGILQPRFPARSEGVRAGFDAATGVLGAGPSIGTDLGFGLYNLVTGNTGEGTKEVIRNLPYARLWLWKNKMNEFTRMLETEIDGPSGFGRY